MPQITLPDESVRSFDQAVTVNDVAKSIGDGLARAAVAGIVDGRMVDTSYVIATNARVEILTLKNQQGLEVLRHSAAHLLAQAVKALFPNVQVTIGPVIENGFYYDFSYEGTFTPEDLKKIEQKMAELAKAAYPVTRQEVSRNDAIKLFAEMGEHYKVQIIEDIPEDETLTLYQQGDFIDLCRGPHTPNTSFIKAFKLTKISGAYWRGDSNNEMLQRIYGTAWPDKASLDTYLKNLEEAEKRDHRKLAKKMQLFHLQEEAPGMAFWHPNGWTLYRIIQEYMRGKLKEYQYQEIKTPQLVDQTLWERSGHLSKFGDEMFATLSEHHTYAVKPMSCPCHIQIYNQGLKSYRELPIRYAEFGRCHRNEPTGALHGLMRVRAFVQDDGHIFCTEDQIADEISSFIKELMSVYQDFGFDEVDIKLSTRPEKRVGSDEIWDKAEHALEEVLNASGYQWEVQPGEGAFYGPKIEFALKDCLGRIWQCGTVQLDFAMPERLDAQYVAEDGSRKTPVMIHRAVFGSMERFIAILIEHYAGNLPSWLAPIQAVVMTITDQHRQFAQEMATFLQKNGIRAHLDLRNEKISYKIREHAIQRVPFQLVIGDKELHNRTVTVRTQSGEDLGAMSIEAALERISGGNQH